MKMDITKNDNLRKNDKFTKKVNRKGGVALKAQLKKGALPKQGSGRKLYRDGLSPIEKGERYTKYKNLKREQ